MSARHGLASDEKMATAGEDEGQLVFLMEMQRQGERGAPGHAHFFHVRMACPPVVPRGAGRHQGGGKREHDVVPGRRLVLDRVVRITCLPGERPSDLEGTKNRMTGLFFVDRTGLS